MDKDIRRCISCRRLAHKREFWRIVRSAPRPSPPRAIALDSDSSTAASAPSPPHDHPPPQIHLALGKEQGRSAYLCPNPNCLNLARKKNRLARALKAPGCELVLQQLEAKLVSEAIHSV